jgi:hypothetical protein
MNEKQYRKKIEAQVAESARAAKRKRVAAKGRSRRLASSDDRIAEIDGMQFDAKSAGQLRGLIRTLGNAEEPVALRQAAFRALKTASFLGPAFAPYRAEYLKCLRGIAIDPEAEIRREALETLAMEKVDFARRLLADGLREPKKALVPAAKAIQILSHDGHAEVAPLVREVLAGSSDPAAKEAAVRFLSSDPGSASLLGSILKDRSQPSRLRSLSAAGLRVINPKLFERAARAIVEDKADNDDVRATCLGALTLIGDFKKTRADPSFAKTVASLQGTKHGRALRQTARRFISRLGK